MLPKYCLHNYRPVGGTDCLPNKTLLLIRCTLILFSYRSHKTLPVHWLTSVAGWFSLPRGHRLLDSCTHFTQTASWFSLHKTPQENPDARRNVSSEFKLLVFTWRNSYTLGTSFKCLKQFCSYLHSSHGTIGLWPGTLDVWLTGDRLENDWCSNKYTWFRWIKITEHLLNTSAEHRARNQQISIVH